MGNRILVVDDEKLIVKGIKFSLEQEGMSVDCAYDGEEAIRLAKENQYDMMLLVVAACVFKAETLRQVIIHLNGAKLPAASDGIFYHEIKFRAIERGLAFHLLCLQAFLRASLYNCIFGKMPVFIAADIFLLIIRITQ